MSPVKPDIDRIGSKTRLTGLFLLLTLLVAPLAGCAAYGPGLTRTSHLAYNEAVQVSAQQELLLNLVRLR